MIMGLMGKNLNSSLIQVILRLLNLINPILNTAHKADHFIILKLIERLLTLIHKLLSENQIKWVGRALVLQ